MNRGYYTQTVLAGIGRIWIAGTGRGLCRLEFKADRRLFLKSLPAGIEWTRNGAKFANLVSQLRRFARGERISFAGKIDLSCGTPFQRRVWNAIATIPWGETRSYAWLARAIGRPKSVRAVANACGANPVPLIIPCHRVIASDGSIGGFSAGIGIKKKLLALEEKRNVPAIEVKSNNLFKYQAYF